MFKAVSDVITTVVVLAACELEIGLKPRRGGVSGYSEFDGG